MKQVTVTFPERDEPLLKKIVASIPKKPKTTRADHIRNLCRKAFDSLTDDECFEIVREAITASRSGRKYDRARFQEALKKLDLKRKLK